jgi:hypothetical protein
MTAALISKYGIILLPFTVATIVTILWLVRAIYLRLRLHYSGVDANARVVRRTVSKGRDIFYYVAYQFSVLPNRDHVYSRQQAVSLNTFHRLKEGTNIQIRYLLANPEISRLSGAHQDDFFLRRGALFAAVFTGGYIYLCLFLSASQH